MGTFLDDVKTRRSVRTFDGRKLSESDLNTLFDIAKNIDNPYHIPVTIAFFDAKEKNLSSPVISGERDYVTAKVTAGPNADVAYGYSFEKFLLAVHKMGLGGVWIGGTMPREKFEAAAELKDGEIMPCISPIGYIASKMSIKESLMRKGVKADIRYNFEHLFFQEDFSTPLSEAQAKSLGLFDAFEAVRFAPSAVNKQPWRLVVSDNCVHFYEKKDRGYDTGVYDVQKIDIGIAMYHFEEALRFEGKSPEFIILNPGIAIDENMEYISSYKFA